MTYQQTIRDKLAHMLLMGIYPGGADKAIDEALAAILEATKGIVPAEKSMEAAHKAHSDAGAGHTIGYNAARTAMLQAIEAKS